MKGTSLAIQRCLSHCTTFHNVSFGLCVSLRNEKPKKVKKADIRYISHISGEGAVYTIVTKIGLFRGLGDGIIPTNFYVDRFSHFGATGGQSWGLP
jgi:hypothetical protein